MVFYRSVGSVGVVGVYYVGAPNQPLLPLPICTANKKSIGFWLPFNNTIGIGYYKIMTP